MDYKGTPEIWGGGSDERIHYLACSNGVMGVRVSKLVKLCALNTCVLVNVNCNSIELLTK